jgi:hypothetical protein
MWTGGVAQVVEHLPSKHEVLSSNPSTAKKKKKRPKKKMKYVYVMEYYSAIKERNPVICGKIR